MLKTTIPAIIAASLIAAAPASAGRLTKQTAFEYSASELATAYGAEKLYERAQNAAEAACADRNNPNPLRVRVLIKRCENSLVDQWVEKIDDGRLKSIHAAARSAEKYAAK